MIQVIINKEHEYRKTVQEIKRVMKRNKGKMFVTNRPESSMIDYMKNCKLDIATYFLKTTKYCKLIE